MAILDTFTDTNGVLLENHVPESGTWTKHPLSSSSLSIRDNRVKATTNNEGHYYHSFTPADANYLVEADFVYVAGAADNVMLMARQSTTTDDAYRLIYNPSVLQWQMTVVTGGATPVSTTLGSFNQALTVGQTYHVALACTDIAKIAYVDGVPIIWSNANALTPIGSPGLRIFGTANNFTTGIWADNFAVSDTPPFPILEDAATFSGTTAPVPTGLAAGDLWGVYLSGDNLTGYTAPSGWTMSPAGITGVSGTGGEMGCIIYKIAVGGESAQALGGSPNGGVSFRVSNVDPVSPVHTSYGSYTASSAAGNIPLTTTDIDKLLLGFTGQTTTARTANPITAGTELIDAIVGTTKYVVNRRISTTAAAYDIGSTWSGNGVKNLQGIAFNAAPAVSGIDLTGTSLGIGDTQSALRIATALAGTSAGQGLSASALRIAVALAGQSLGTGLSESVLRIAVALAGESLGTGLTLGDLTSVPDTAVSLEGSSLGIGDSQAALRIATALVGTSLGIGDSQAALRIATTLAGISLGQGQSSSILRIATALAGTSLGLGDTQSALRIITALAGISTGQGNTASALRIATALAGTSLGIGQSQSVLRIATALAGTSLGIGNSQTALRIAVALAGTSLGQGLTLGYLSASGEIVLAGTSLGIGDTQAALQIATALAGTSLGQGQSAAALRIAMALAGVSQGQADEQAILAIAMALAGTSLGTGLTLGDLLVSAPFTFGEPIDITERAIGLTASERSLALDISDRLRLLKVEH